MAQDERYMLPRDCFNCMFKAESICHHDEPAFGFMCDVAIDVYPVKAKCCGLPVREVPKHIFEQLFKVGIPLQQPYEKFAWQLVEKDECEWYSVSYGGSELEVTPHYSKQAAGFLMACESYGERDCNYYPDMIYEVWNVIGALPETHAVKEVA